MAIMFTGNDKKEYIVRTAEDSNGNLIAHEICEFKRFGDVRVCSDFDRATTHRDMKDANRNSEFPISAYRMLTELALLMTEAFRKQHKLLISLVGAQGLEPWTR